MASYEYKCTQCSKVCESLGKYNRHLKTHSKPYRCQSCKRGFALRTDLNRHDKAHHMLGNARYACHIGRCTFTATRPYDRSRHLKIVHRQDLCSHLLKDSKEFRETDSSESGHSPGTEPSKSTPASSTPHQLIWTCNMFLQAATAGNLSVLEACIISGMDVNIVADDESSPLHCAARAGHTSAVQYLINRGADIEARNEKDRTPLQEAIISRSSDTVNLLLQGGAHLDFSDVTVNVLAQSESQEILKLCFDHLGEGIPHNMMYNILCAASKGGHKLTVAALLSLFENRLDSVDTTKGVLERVSGKTRSQRPDISGAPETTRVLQCTPLHLAAASGYLDIVQLLVKHHCNINTMYWGTTPLHRAARAGHTNVVEFMLSLPNIEPNCLSSSIFTPLHLAVNNGRTEVVQLLLKHAEVDINHRGGNLQQTLLHLAANNGRVEVVELLLKHAGIDINPCDHLQKTPLHLAADGGRVEVVELLLKHAGIDANPFDKDYRTPLQLAAGSGHVKVVAFLLQQESVDTCCHDKDKLTALLLAALHGHYNVAQALLDYEETSTINDTIIQTLEQRRVNPGEVMERVLEHSDFLTVDINLLDETVWYRPAGFLSSAIRKGECDVVQVLLNHKDIDVNLKTRGYLQTTPLCLAVKLGQTDVVKLLLQHEKINVNLGEFERFTQRRSPLQVAKEKGFSEIVDLLLAKGAEDPGSFTPMPCNNHTIVSDSKMYESHVEYPAVYNSLL